MANCQQPGRNDKFELNRSFDLFVYTDSGAVIRIGVKEDGIVILPINGVRLDLVVVNGCAGVEFTEKKLYPS